MGSKTTDSLIDIAITLLTKVVGMVVDIDDIKEFQKELKEDYIINEELSKVAGSLSLFCGLGMALANAGFITSKHAKGLKHGEETETPESDPYVNDHYDGRKVHTRLAPGRDINGYPLEGGGIDEGPKQQSPQGPVAQQSTD